MQTRSLEQIIPAIATMDGGGVKLRRSLGQSQTIRLDPFLMLDEFSSNEANDYIAGFPDHPHRGFETLTYILDGHMLHRDHLGNQGDLKSGGAQWMTAGRGIIHSEMPQQESGRMRGFQLWINLPAREKMKPAAYRDIQAHEIAQRVRADGSVIKVLAGTVTIDSEVVAGPIQGMAVAPTIADVRLSAGADFVQPCPVEQQVGIYVYEGSVQIGAASAQRVLEAQHFGILSAGDTLNVSAGSEPAAFLLLAAAALNEPIVQYGPFVMNTRAEIEQAIADYNNGSLV